MLKGHTGPPETTPRTTRDQLVPHGEICALAKLIQNMAPEHPFDESYDPAIVNAILAYHGSTTQQRLHLHSASDDPCEWHPIGAPTLEVYLHGDAATRAHTITDLRPVTLQPVPEPYIAPSLPQPRPPGREGLPTENNAEPTTTVPHMAKPLNTHQLPTAPQGNHTRLCGRYRRLERDPVWGNHDGRHQPHRNQTDETAAS